MPVVPPPLPPLVYLHGLNSSSRSVKATALAAAFDGNRGPGRGEARLLVPDYPAHRPALAMARLCTDLAADLPPVLIGSSMGGFYAQALARRLPVARLYLINPALEPWDLWARFAAVTQVNGQGEPYRLDPADCATLRALDRSPQPEPERVPLSVPTTLFLDRGDEVLDARIALARYTDQARLCVWDGGDHGFTHLAEAIAIIRADLAADAAAAVNQAATG